MTAPLWTVNQARIRPRNEADRERANVPRAATAMTDDDPRTTKSTASAAWSARAHVGAKDLPGCGNDERVGGRVDPQKQGSDDGDLLDRVQPARLLRRRQQPRSREAARLDARTRRPPNASNANPMTSSAIEATVPVVALELERLPNPARRKAMTTVIETTHATT